MKNIFYFLTILIVAISFSGCATGKYDIDYISKDIKNNIVKINDIKICILEDNSIIKRYVNDRNYGFNLEMETGNINNNIEKSVFEQYFKDVKIGCNKENIIIINSKVTDFRFKFGLFGESFITYDLTIKVFKNEKNILEKKYHKEDNDKIIYTIGRLESSNTIELFHRSLLSFYETDFKKDLLEALQK